MDEARISDATSESDYDTARELFQEYSAATGVANCFQGFAEELRHLPDMYGPPRGRLILARIDGRPVGCGAIRPLAPDVCELKRVYVRAGARGTGLGRALTNALIDRGRAAGYRTMVLDTLETMVAARALYHSLGFEPRSPYYPDPLPGVTFMELTL